MHENELKKMYLQRYRISKQREQELLDELNTLEGRFILPSKVIDDMPHGGAGDQDLSEFAAQYDAIYRKLKEQYRKSIRIYEQISDAIEAMEGGEGLKTLLRYRYISGYSWEQVAVNMHYSYRRVTQLHGLALEAFRIPKDCL
jgi:hypothetical protein